MVTRLLLLQFTCTARKAADVGFNNVVKNGKQKTKQKTKQNKKTSAFARSAISLFDQIMSITRLYIVLVFGAGADWKNARVNVSYCTLRGVSWRNRHFQRKKMITYNQIQFWKQGPT